MVGFSHTTACHLAAALALPIVTAHPNSFLAHAGPNNSAPVYLVQVGADSGCCVGGLTIFMTDTHRKPVKKVFDTETFVLKEIRPLEDCSGIDVIGQSTDSEAWTRKHAFSYDPYVVYRIKGTSPARYSLSLSKAFSEAHYCPWKGAHYSENYAAVTFRNGQCRVMNRQQLDLYEAKDPGWFR